MLDHRRRPAPGRRGPARARLLRASAARWSPTWRPWRRSWPRTAPRPLSFDDPDAAEETLAALRGQAPRSSRAAVYDENGELLAIYRRGEEGGSPDSRRARGRTATSSGDGLPRALSEPVVLDGRADRHRLPGEQPERALGPPPVPGPDRGRRCSWLAALAALALSSGLQRLISRPILRLAETARAVSEHNDYSSARRASRAPTSSGQLVDAFNQMLEPDPGARLPSCSGQGGWSTGSRSAPTPCARSSPSGARRAELAERNAELQRATSELDDFAYIASHDLKEPLRGIHNYSIFLLEDYGDKLDADGQVQAGDPDAPHPAHGGPDRLPAPVLPARPGRPGDRRGGPERGRGRGAWTRSASASTSEQVEVRVPRPLPSGALRPGAGRRDVPQPDRQRR